MRYGLAGGSYLDNNGKPLSGGKRLISHEELKDRLDYNPETGIFTLKKRPRFGGNTKIGEQVGSAHSAGYLALTLNCTGYLLHRLAWFYVHGQWPEHVDHINHNRTDNRLCNLRATDRAGNQKNQSLRTTNVVGIPGVHWDASRAKWAPKIRGNGKLVNLGRFDDFFEACCARKSAEITYGYHQQHGRSA